MRVVRRGENARSGVAGLTLLFAILRGASAMGVVAGTVVATGLASGGMVLWSLPVLLIVLGVVLLVLGTGGPAGTLLIVVGVVLAVIGGVPAWRGRSGGRVR